MFDSQADIAALAYGPAEDPDGILCAFAAHLSRSGHRAVGLIQRSRRGAAAAKAVSALALPTGTAVSLRHDGRPLLTGCHLDADELAAMRAQLAQAIAVGADLVIINRFGKLELGGGGFLAEIKQAVAAEIPVVIAVPQALFMAWTRFSCGMAVKLACAQAPLDSWWRSVSRRGEGPRKGEDFCAVEK